MSLKSVKRVCKHLFIRSALAVLVVYLVGITLRACAVLPPSPPSPPPLEAHTYTPGGLLVVNPHGAHPVFELMRAAEDAWAAKRARASTTLREAVAEYERRYARAPPRGFDKWWDFVVRHGVQLPDEYDEIHHDVEPFWGVDPGELARTRAALLERGVDVVTVAKTTTTGPGAPLEIVHTTLGGDRAGPFRRINDVLELVRDVAHELPPMRVTFSHHDTPGMLSHWATKNMALEAARAGKTVGQDDFPPVHKLGWTEACPPDSPARRNPPLLPLPRSTPPERGVNGSSMPKTFIASHRATMDPCMHPELLVTHGQFLSHNVGPFPQHTLVPRFSHCATLLHHDIRPPVPYGWVSEEGLEEGGDVPWSEKEDERLNWRGSTTGLYASPDKAWAYAQRFRLVAMANALEGNTSVLRVNRHESERVGGVEEVALASVNPAWMDVAFAGQPIGCDQARGSCKEMEAWVFKKTQGRKEEGRYKFILDVDGNGWSGRFKRLLSSNSLIFKATIYPEWYTSRIAPWVHYVPVQISYADLYDTLAFFREHDDLAARIARQGKEWSREFWRKEDMAAYLYRLLLEYARVSSPDREAMAMADVGDV